jgi:predicted RNA-binding Zn ribbon-like protein
MAMIPDSLEIPLSFANTAGWHAGPDPDEHLTSYEAALAWAAEQQIIDETQIRALRSLAVERSGDVGGALARIVGVREAVYRMFVAAAHGHRPEPADLALLNDVLAESTGHLRLAAASGQDGPAYEWTWVGLEGDLAGLLWPVARAAAALLTSPQLVRVRDCANETCGWLFIDRSKNGSRRWCDMGDCGNRAKAKRFRERKKGSLIS